jgi:hypothetical protein
VAEPTGTKTSVPTRCPVLVSCLLREGLDAEGCLNRGGCEEEEAKSVAKSPICHDVHKVEALWVVGLGDERRLCGEPAVAKGKIFVVAIILCDFRE